MAYQTVGNGLSPTQGDSSPSWNNSDKLDRWTTMGALYELSFSNLSKHSYHFHLGDFKLWHGSA